MHIEKLRTVQQFIKVQASICVTFAIIFAINKNFEYIYAIVLAAVLQWIQLYAWSKPNRVASTEQWLKGVFKSIVLKYFVLVAILITLFALLPEDFFLKNPEQFFKVAIVFFAAYSLPYWYLGISASKFSTNDQSKK